MITLRILPYSIFCKEIFDNGCLLVYILTTFLNLYVSSYVTQTALKIRQKNLVLRH